MNEGLLGTFKLSSSDNYDAYLKSLGVGLVTRKMASSVSPVVTISTADGTTTIKEESTFKSSSIDFVIGQEFDEVTIDGRQVKTTITENGNKLVEVQKGDKDATITRYIEDDNLKEILAVDDVVATRVYTRQ